MIGSNSGYGTGGGAARPGSGAGNSRPPVSTSTQGRPGGAGLPTKPPDTNPTASVSRLPPRTISSSAITTTASNPTKMDVDVPPVPPIPAIFASTPITTATPARPPTAQPPPTSTTPNVTNGDPGKKILSFVVLSLLPSLFCAHTKFPQNSELGALFTIFNRMATNPYTTKSSTEYKSDINSRSERVVRAQLGFFDSLTGHGLTDMELDDLVSVRGESEAEKMKEKLRIKENVDREREDKNKEERESRLRWEKNTEKRMEDNEKRHKKEMREIQDQHSLEMTNLSSELSELQDASLARLKELEAKVGSDRTDVLGRLNTLSQNLSNKMSPLESKISNITIKIQELNTSVIDKQISLVETYQTKLDSLTSSIDSKILYQLSSATVIKTF